MTLAELTTDGKPNASWAPLEAGLIERATSSVRISRDKPVISSSAER